MDVVLVSKADLQTDLLVALMRRSIHQKIFLLTSLDLPPIISEQASLYIFDLACVDINTCSSWLSLTHEFAYIKAVFVNVKDDAKASALIALPHVYGIFFRSIDGRQLARGLKVVLDGEYCFPQRVLCHHLEKTRTLQCVLDAEENVQLSSKQRQLLMLLLHGYSNEKIADKLAISIPTVKTHFYRLYKKLGVHNRTQAAAWAQSHRQALVEH